MGTGGSYHMLQPACSYGLAVHSRIYIFLYVFKYVYLLKNADSEILLPKQGWVRCNPWFEKAGFTLPFSPPPSLLLHLKYHRDQIWKLTEPYLSMDLRVVAAQDLIVPPEVPTPGYRVINLGAGGKIRIMDHLLSVNFQVQNLLNSKYFDHTSYYRLINVPEASRSFIVNITVPFSNQLNRKTNK